MNVVAITETAVPIDMLGRRVANGLERAKHAGKSEWISGSLEAATCLYAARQRFDTNHRAFGTWLKTQNFGDLTPNDRMALIHLGEYPDKARVAFEQTPLRVYRLIWEEVRASWGYIVRDAIYQRNRGRPVKEPKSKSKSAPKRETGVRRRATGSYAETNRKLQLGDDYERLISTSLGPQKEMDALIELKDHYPDIANGLIARAVAGETVSARAVYADKDRDPKPTIDDLTTCWMRHMLPLWLRASEDVRNKFIEKIWE